MDPVLEPFTEFFLNVWPQPFFLAMLSIIAAVLNGFFGLFGLNTGIIPV